MQVAQAVEAFECEREHHQQPADQQAGWVVVADVLQGVAVFGVIEALVLDLPAALGDSEQGARADLC